MGKRFHQVPQAKIPRSSFNRSHGYKTTFDAGYLVPVYVDDVLPGDTFNLRMNAFARLGTPIKPVMDNLYLDSFFFFVPNRLVWDNFQKFMGEQTNPGDSTDFTLPQNSFQNGPYLTGSLEDYFGLQVDKEGWNHCVLPIRAYWLIWNEWFRDQNLQNSIVIDTGDGPDVPPTGGNALLRRGKRHDYFTSCLPWPQKGDAVTIPVSGTADVISESGGTGPSGAWYPEFQDQSAFPKDAWLQTKQAQSFPDLGVQNAANDPWGSNQALFWQDPHLVADMTTMTAVTINEMRQAFQIQKLLERDARGGTRYTEIVKSHFNVTSDDARLQRPEYLGGGSTPVVIAPIAQTSMTTGVTDETPQGNLAAMGTVNVTGHGFAKSFTEHGWIIGLVSVRADLTYQQGVERMWNRRTRYDMYWPAFAGLGEQIVERKEIFIDGLSQGRETWGYQERYAEYRYKPSKITGLFRSLPSAGNETLHIWHLSEYWTTVPSLNASFIEDNPPISRVLAVQDEPQFLFDSYFQLTCARPMPVYGVPGLIDHF